MKERIEFRVAILPGLYFTGRTIKSSNLPHYHGTYKCVLLSCCFSWCFKLAVSCSVFEFLVYVFWVGDCIGLGVVFSVFGCSLPCNFYPSTTCACVISIILAFFKIILAFFISSRLSILCMYI
jgi:uncharacterized membrane protein YeiH